MKQKIANVISIIGHPLLTMPIFIAIVMFTTEDFKKASFISFLIIGCIFVPLIIRMYMKSKNGTYTNFDVSDRMQRKSLFIFIIPLLAIVTFVIFKTKYNNLFLSILFATLLVFISQGVNLFIKSSLHVSFNICLSFLVITMNYKIGIILFLFTGLLCWSRDVLSRHNLKEVLVGSVLGLTIILIMLYIEGYL
jgi:hypothetical protein